MYKLGRLISMFFSDVLRAVFGKGFETELRRRYYRDIYLKSDEWKRKRYVVLKRDHWRCQYCGKRATQVHHERYAYNIGKEPIHWLVSLCGHCHAEVHDKF